MALCSIFTPHASLIVQAASDVSCVPSATVPLQQAAKRRSSLDMQQTKTHT